MSTTNETMVAGAADWADSELLARMLLRGGDAWREFHRRYDRLVYRCIHKVTGRFSHILSNEDVHEIYAQLMIDITSRDMHKLRTFDAARGNKLSSWIGMLATHAAWDHLRTLARQPHSAVLADAELVSSPDANPYDQMLSKERWGRVNETLSTFSSKDRDFVRLFFVDGLTPEQIAAEMQISVKTVYSKKHKIRCRLEAALGAELEAA